MTNDDKTKREQFQSILEDVGTVMLSTHARDGAVHTRPMAVARVTDDGMVYLSTDAGSVKVEELRADPRCQLVFQSKTQYAVLDGTVEIRRDRALVDELWKDSWKLWFPKGKDDPDITILVIDPVRGEYWDQSGTRGLSFLYRAAKAYVSGKEMKPNPESHGKVSL